MDTPSREPQPPGWILAVWALLIVVGLALLLRADLDIPRLVGASCLVAALGMSVAWQHIGKKR